ncbi:MAG: lipid-A-disaccharide synthase [Gammaproteobacteria bacterium]|nr:lipid-A-disaccharide synthase [Gammaproteobacteria bacterium]
MPRVAIIAGEPSGDQLGAGLIEALLRRRPDLEIEGIAGPRMQAAGCRPWRDSDELAVMGLFEVTRHLPRLLGIIRDTRRRLLADPPAALVGIDAPDFNFRVEPTAKRAGIPTVHYVCPQIWAWRQGRVKDLHHTCDRVLCLLPFEEKFLHEHAVPATFVGHPLADDIPANTDRAAARLSLGLPAAGPLVAVLPGSRAGEVGRLGPLFAATAAQLRHSVAEIRFASPMATPLVRDIFQQAIEHHAPGCDFHLFDGRAREVLCASDVVLIASGTATLETMLVNRPMVVAYRLAPLTYQVARVFRLVDVEHFALPNLLADRRLVPELLQHEATPAALATELLSFLESPERRAAVAGEFAKLRDLLRRGASERAATAVLDEAGLG